MLGSKIMNGELPSGYKRCEYLESTGTQWIDTGIVPVYGDEVNMIVQRMVIDASLFYAGQKNNFCILCNNTDCYTKYFQKDYTSAISFSNDYFGVDGLYHNVIFNYAGVAIDGLNVCGITDHKSTVNTNLILFRTYSQFGKIRMKSFKLIRSGENMLNLIPALDQSGRPCMYDTVTKQPFYNLGTGEFLYEISSSGGY